jgi:hypothetical protein
LPTVSVAVFEDGASIVNSPMKSVGGLTLRVGRRRGRPDLPVKAAS